MKTNVRFKRMIVEAGRQMIADGLTVGTWGNISVQDPETGLIYIKPSGMDYGKIVEDDVVVMNSEYQIVEGNRKPSIEHNFHIGIMNARDDVFAVVHTHPVYSSIFGVLRQEIPAVCEDFAQIVGESVICCEYALPGTKELAKNVERGLGDRGAVLIPNHGAVCVGASLADAFKVSFVLEKSARIYYMAKSVGNPHLISSQDVKAMQDFVKTSYGQDK